MVKLRWRKLGDGYVAYTRMGGHKVTVSLKHLIDVPWLKDGGMSYSFVVYFGDHRHYSKVLPHVVFLTDIIRGHDIKQAKSIIQKEYDKLRDKKQYVKLRNHLYKKYGIDLL